MLFAIITLTVFAIIMFAVNTLVKRATEGTNEVIAEVTAQQLDMTKYARTFEQLDVLTDKLHQKNGMQLHLAHAKY